MSLNYKAIYTRYHKENQISLKESILRIHLLADFIEQNAWFISTNQLIFQCDKQIGVQDDNLNSSVIAFAAQDPKLNAKGLWLAKKVSTDIKDFSPLPYPSFKTLFRVNYNPLATTQEQADASFERNPYYSLDSFLGLSGLVYTFLFAHPHYEYSFAVQKHMLIFWMKELKIPEQYWSTLDLEPKPSFVRVGPMDMVKRMRALANVLEHSPVENAFDACVALFDQSESDLADKAKREAFKKRWLNRFSSVFNLFRISQKSNC